MQNHHFVLTAILVVLAAMSNRKGYFDCVTCLPSLSQKWPQSIKGIIPRAKVRVIERIEQLLIQFLSAWTNEGRSRQLYQHILQPHFQR